MLAASAAVFAQAKDEKKPVGDKPAAKQAGAADKGGAPGEDAMMKIMQEMSAPGKEHEALKPLVGSFTCSVKLPMAPAAPAKESKGVYERKWILGGRYVAEEYRGETLGMPVEGFGIMGYDKLQKQYHAYWIDSWGTGTWMMTGTTDASGKTLTLTGENFNAVTKSKKKGRSTREIIDNDKHVMKWYDIGPDGKEFMNFEITCTRK
jgi:hypothetical protein